MENEVTIALIAAAGGAGGAAIINQVFGLISAKRGVRGAMCKALRYLLLDKILFLGTKYIEVGTVDFDDRRRLNQMHEVYHDGLLGNGDADNIMLAVNKLPLS